MTATIDKEGKHMKWYRLYKESEEMDEPKFDIGDKVWYKSIQVTIIDMKPSIKGGFRYQIKETLRPNSTASCWRSGEEIFATKEESEEYERKKEEEHKKRLEDDEKAWRKHLWARAAHSPADHYGVQRSYGSPNYTGD